MYVSKSISWKFIRTSGIRIEQRSGIYHRLFGRKPCSALCQCCLLYTSLSGGSMRDFVLQIYRKSLCSCLLYTSVANGMGVAGCIKLDCRYEGTRFVPARPSVKNNSVFAWKKALSQSQAVSSFIEFSRIYIKRISSNTT